MTHQEVITYVLNGKANFSEIKKSINDTKILLSKLQIPSNVQASFNKLFADLNNSIDKFVDKSNNIVDKKGLNDLKRIGIEIKNTSKEIQDSFAKNITNDVWSNIYTSKSVDELREKLKSLYHELENFDTVKTQGLQQALKLLQAAYENKRTPNAVKALADALKTNEFNRIGTIVGQLKQLKAVSNDPTLTKQLDDGLKSVKSTTADLQQQIVSVENQIDNLIASDNDFQNATNSVTDSIKNEHQVLTGLVNDTYAVGEANYFASQNVERFAAKFRQLLSYGSGLALLRRSIQNAYRTVKELDAAMTETATVTDYSVGQMWDKLDDYTAIANKLGATTLGTYKTITLFFQQGLDEAQSLALATETMKMARVANIDYAEATQYMTSALRGFNMELNETSATRVNDVYSELAKITAADTNQIAVAMSKVASLANSANMELETTSAFLSQIIETTQEAPETAGTALKTIIARFSEVKRLFSEGELTGTDEEGETVDVNKIGGALRTVGIDLNKYISGAVGLDEIFLELAEKWDSLDLVTQRYIATQAAGSRQQSRFIAMMQNYGRTMELVNAAYSSAGSGQEQFEKTLESLEAKLNKLKNAWDSFSQSITRSDLIKDAVDALTNLLTIINNIADAIPILGERVGGIFRLLMGYGLFKGGQALFDAPLSSLLNTFEKTKSVQLSMIAANKALSNSFKTVGKSFTTFLNPIQHINQQRALRTQPYDTQIEEITKLLHDSQAKFFKAESDLSRATILGTQPTEEQQKAFEDAGKEVDIYTQKLKSLKVAQQDAANSFTKFDAILVGFSSVATDAGIALTALGAVLTKVGNDKNNEAMQKLGSTLTTWGAVALAVGQLAAVLPKLATALALTTPQLTLLLIALGALAAGFMTGIENNRKYQQHLEDLYNQSNKVSESISELSSKMDELASTKAGLEDLTEGSAKWYEQLAKIKDIIDQLIEENPEIEDFLHYDPVKGYTIDEDKYTEWLKNRNSQRDSAAGVEAVHVRTTGRRETATYWTSMEEAAEYDAGQILSGGKFGYDVDALSDFYNISKESVEEAIDIAMQQREKTDVNWAKDFIERITGQTEFESEDEIFNYFEELILSRLLEVQAKHAREEFENQNLRDKVGQNIYANAQDQNLSDSELTQKLDLSLVNHEDAAALEKYWGTLKELPDILHENKNLLKELALDTGASLENFDKLAESVKDNKDNLEKLSASSINFQKSLGAVAKQAKEIFGETFDASFIEKNLPNFIEAFTEGSQQALDALRDQLWLTMQVNLDQNNIDTIKSVLTYLSQDRSFQLTGTADLTTLFQEVFKGEEITVEKLKSIQKQIQDLGFELAINYNKDDSGNITGITGVVLHDTASSYLSNLRGAGGNKGGGGSKTKEKAWENPYDQLYNLTERNEEAIRKRNILEKEYNALLRDRESEVNSLVKLSLQELVNLQEQLAYQKQLQAGRLKQINAVDKETWTDSEGNRKSYEAWGVTQYARYNQETKAIEIDWDAIDKVTDQTKGKAIEDYIKRLEELQKEFEQTDEDILDIEAEIDEINRRSKDDFLSLEQRVYDAIVKQHQEVIDAYSSFNDTLNDTNDKILSSLREQIDLERQIRDNTQTEQDIAEKEARLAYLQRDTSGANATETLKLQKEIDDARQAYSDSLIDQQIDSIEKGNEKAAEQRQIQIQTMQAQLDYWTKIGAFWSTVSDLLTNAIDPETGKLDKNNSALVSLLMSEENFGGLSEFGQMDWYDDLVEAFNKGMEGFGNFKMQQAEEAGEITQGGNTYKYDKEKKAWMLGNEAYSAVYDPVTGQYIFTRNKTEDVKTGTIGEPKEEIKADKEKESQGSPTPPPSTSTPVESYTVTYNNGEWSTTVKAKSATDAINMASELYKKAKGFGSNFPAVAWKGKAVATKLNGTLRYASGGMANFTGPAWLDGTKSKPEAVLSAKQTELFISLRDMLERFGQSGGFNNSYGNTYVDLDVNADIGSDYDVDSLVSRLKRDILESSSYRNVNMLSRGH